MSAPSLAPGEVLARCQRVLKVGDLAAIVLDSSSPRDLAHFAAREGLVYPGCRIETMPPPVLAKDLSQDALNDPVVFARLAAWLTHRNLAPIENTRTSPTGLLGSLHVIAGTLVERGQLGPVLWSLLTDPRPEAEAVIPQMMAAARKSIQEEIEDDARIEGLWHRLSKGVPAKKDNVKAAGMIRALSDDILAKEKEIQRLARDNLDYVEKLSSITGQVSSLGSALQEARQEKTALTRQLHQAQKDL